ncbi:hypothetical protein [Actinophytocola gossypii]|uniref:Uncharacterized protein n=1 Tax=Actinophytocola gossypii TaxID=2812003 RepID=A0ABT2J4R4_9PSEU|nr:hypothetical protein [Actinophytocola gossypii]MCT2582848.1 hypothetical protein [Actinophytocola gossypii]
MDQAERELDARIDYAFAKARAAEQQAEDMERRAGPPEPPTDEDVERIKAYVEGHGRTEEWQRVIERINRGEVTWRQVVEGLATGRLDHGVAAAFDSLSRVPPASMEKLVEIGVAEPEQPEPPAEEEPPRPEPPSARRRRPVEEEDEDSFFENPLMHRRR